MFQVMRFSSRQTARASRLVGKAQASVAKQRGAGSRATRTRRSVVGEQAEQFGIFGDIGRFLGRAAREIIGRPPTTGPTGPTGPFGPMPTAPREQPFPDAPTDGILDRLKDIATDRLTSFAACEPGFRRDPATGQCVRTGGFVPAAERFFGTDLPGGTVQENGRATVGSFGLPAVVPEAQETVRRRCPRMMVLGRDNLCYPRAILGRRSKFRKWRQPARPPISRKDVNAIRRAAAARERVKELAKDAGFKTPQLK